MKDPKNGPKECSDFIDELVGIIRDAGPEASTYKTVATVEYKMKLKVKPLYIERMQRLNRNPEVIEWNKAQFEKDKKKFMTTQRASLVGIGDSDLPPWFKAIEARRRYTELVVRAVDDPEAEELRQSFHHRAQDELRGTQD